jgi:hypothetical protein
LQRLKNIVPRNVYSHGDAMKTLVALGVLVGGLAAAPAQDVFVLGGPGSTPVPPIVYQPPIVTGAYPVVQPVMAVPVVPVCPTAYVPPCNYNYYDYRASACSPGYYDYYPSYSPSVLAPFGREQAYRHGYRFNHPR